MESNGFCCISVTRASPSASRVRRMRRSILGRCTDLPDSDRVLVRLRPFCGSAMLTAPIHVSRFRARPSIASPRDSLTIIASLTSAREPLIKDDHSVISLERVQKEYATAAGSFTALRDVHLEVGAG